jgi:hypothetical protein
MFPGVHNASGEALAVVEKNLPKNKDALLAGHHPTVTP